MHTSKMSINETEFHLQSLSAVEPKGQILIVHGLGEHIGRYGEVFQLLADIGLNVYGYDRRGEGQSGGRRAYIHSMDDQVADLVAMKRELLTGNLPIFIYAHSLGGLITVKYLIDRQPVDIDGVVLSGALLKVDEGISPLLQKISGLVSAVAPRLKTVKVDTDLLSRNTAIKPAYEADPCCYHGGTPARTGHQILQSTAYVQRECGAIKVPMLITHGGADKLSDPKGSQLLYDRISSADKTLKIYPGLYHEIMHEPEKQLFFDDVQQWLKDRLPGM